MDEILDSHQTVFATGDLFHPSPSQLDQIDGRLYGLGKFRVILLRDASSPSPWNFWVERWRTKGRTRILATIDALSFKCYSAEGTSWSTVEGKRELTIVDGGCLHDAGSNICEKSFFRAMNNLIGRKASKYKPLMFHPHRDSTHFPEGVNNCGHTTDTRNPPQWFNPTSIQIFWNQWDDLAIEREILLKYPNVDWEGIKQLLIKTNVLLKNCHDRSINRLARLAKLPLDFDIGQPGRYIYIMYCIASTTTTTIW